MKVSLQVDSGHVELQFASTVDVDPRTQQLVIRVAGRGDDSVPTDGLSQYLQLRDVKHGTMFSCVASAGDNTAEPALYFDAEIENAASPTKVELLWCRDGEESLGILACRTEALATDQTTGGIVREPVGEPALPAEITVEELPDGVRYRLPKRPYPDVKPPRQGVFNAIIVLIGLGWVSLMIGGMISMVDELPRSVERTPVVWAMATLIGCAVGFPGLIPAAIWCYGLWLDRGSEIVLRNGQLSFADFIGPFRRCHGSREIGELTQLLVIGPDHVAGRQIRRHTVNKPEIVANVPGLFNLAWGYPTRWLFPLAEHLAERVTIARRETGSRRRRTSVGNQVDLEVYDNVNPAEFHRDVRLQPEGNKSTVARTEDGLTLTVPPDRNIVRRARNSRTVCRGAQVLSVVLAAALAAIFWNGPPHHLAAIGGTILLATVSLSVWCFAVSASLDMSRRQSGCFTATVASDRLTVQDTARFPGTRRTWHGDEIAVIVTGPARLDSLDGEEKTSGHELQIHLHDGEIVGLLDGHELEELLWIATVLRESLGVRAINPPEY